MIKLTIGMPSIYGKSAYTRAVEFKDQTGIFPNYWHTDITGNLTILEIDEHNVTSEQESFIRLKYKVIV